MINNKDIHDCSFIAYYSNTINHSSKIGDYEVIISDVDLGFKLFCNEERKCYVLFVNSSESFLVTDFKKTITQFWNNTEKDIQFENGKCDRGVYEKACKIMNKTALYLDEESKINKFICVGFYDGGSISSAIVTIVRHNYYENIKYNNKFERYNNNIYGIVFAGFQTFSPEINKSTRKYILNFSLENEKCIDLNLKQTLPGTFFNLGTWTNEKDTSIKSFFKKKSSYIYTNKAFLVQYQNAIREFVDDNENIVDIKVLLMKCNSKSKKKHFIVPNSNQENVNQQDLKNEIKQEIKSDSDNNKKDKQPNMEFQNKK